MGVSGEAIEVETLAGSGGGQVYNFEIMSNIMDNTERNSSEGVGCLVMSVA